MKKSGIMVLVIVILCVCVSPELKNFLVNEVNVAEEYQQDEMNRYETTRYYAVDSYYPFYLSAYDQQILCLTLKERAEGLADEAEVTIKKTDSGYYVVGISLIYDGETNRPSLEESNILFNAIISKGLLEGYVGYQTDNEIKLFNNLDVELSETTVMVPLSDTDDEYYFSVGISLKKDIANLLLNNEKEEISVLLDGAVLLEAPVSEVFHADRPNYLHYNFESYNVMEIVHAVSKTYPLKYELSEIKWSDVEMN